MKCWTRLRRARTLDNININLEEEGGKNNVIGRSSNKNSNNNPNPFYLSPSSPSLGNSSDFSHKI